MLFGYLAALSRLDLIVFVIQIVVLKLHDFDLGIFRKDLIEHIRGIMEGKSKMANLSFFFQLKRRLISAASFEVSEPIFVLRMH